MVIKIAWSGAHSSAKSTTVNRIGFLFDFLEKKKGGFRFQTVPEVARMCPLPISEESGFEAQQWMIVKQCMLEQYAERDDELDYVLCDRSMWDMLVYSLVLFRRGNMPEFKYNIIKDLVLDYVERFPYDAIFFCEKRDLIDDGVRSVDKDFQDEVYKAFKEVFKAYSVKVIQVQ